MSMYHVCPDCGASLDAGEICDCQTASSTKTAPHDESEKNSPNCVVGGIDTVISHVCEKLDMRQKMKLLKYAQELAQKKPV